MTCFKKIYRETSKGGNAEKQITVYMQIKYKDRKSFVESFGVNYNVIISTTNNIKFQCKN